MMKFNSKKTKLIILFLLYFINFSFFQKKELDSRIVGKWTNIFAKDVHGEIIKDDFYKKGYVDTFLKNGQHLIDPNFLRDDLKRNGIKEPLDYSLIPTFSWRTFNDQILEISGSGETQQIRYGFSGDTLLLGYSNGNTRYLIKRK
ncbi:hypothetical protein [Rhodonellum sp.]|uniref:hypothetical protein n=1 Tax=Rhodonellum sp. TaxID=2231180 RepID=UPI002719FF40|nr:hypothetical protein [Rhodonellum sp.]MDO9552762.1 hypothetical protein [Rhodonellum sp.]